MLNERNSIKWKFKFVELPRLFFSLFFIFIDFSLMMVMLNINIYYVEYIIGKEKNIHIIKNLLKYSLRKIKSYASILGYAIPLFFGIIIINNYLQ